MITVEEEVELAQRIRKGDRVASVSYTHLTKEFSLTKRPNMEFTLSAGMPQPVSLT